MRFCGRVSPPSSRSFSTHCATIFQSREVNAAVDHGGSDEGDDPGLHAVQGRRRKERGPGPPLQEVPTAQRPTRQRCVHCWSLFTVLQPLRLSRSPRITLESGEALSQRFGFGRLQRERV